MNKEEQLEQVLSSPMPTDSTSAIQVIIKLSSLLSEKRDTLRCKKEGHPSNERNSFEGDFVSKLIGEGHTT